MSRTRSLSGIDRVVLVSNLVAGGTCLLVALPWLGPLLFLIGALYVVAGSVLLAAAYAHQPLTVRREALTWLVPWLVAVAVWAGVLGAIEFENTASHYFFALSAGLIVATPCYLVWQVVSLAVRQFMTRSRPVGQPPTRVARDRERAPSE